MIEIPKTGETGTGPDGQKTGKTSPDPADVSAMKALMNRETSANDLSSLFSAQMNRKRTDKTDLDERIRNFEEKKALEERDVREGNSGPGDQDNSGQDHREEIQAEDLAKEVAEQILVSDPGYKEADAADEVRIKIKDSILKDAHVHLVRTDALLKVRLMTGHLPTVRILEQSEESLQKRLQKNFKGQIEIKTIYLAPEDNDEHV